MSIQASCNHCGQQYSVNDGLAGKQATCTACGKTFIINSTQAIQAKLLGDSNDPLGPVTSQASPFGQPPEFGQPTSPGMPAFQQPAYQTAQQVGQQPNKKTGPPLALWLAIGGGIAALLIVVAVVMIVILSSKTEPQVVSPNADTETGTQKTNSSPKSDKRSTSATDKANGATVTAKKPAEVTKLEPWNLAPDLVPGAAPSLTDQPILFGKVNVRDVFFSNPRIARAALWSEPFAGGNPSVAIFDLANGKELASAELPKRAEVMDFSGDGTRMLFKAPKEGSSFTEELTVLSLDGATLIEVDKWRPSSREQSSIRQAHFISNDRVLVSEVYSYALTLWTLPAHQATYSVKLPPNAKPLLSRGRKYIFFRDRTLLNFFDTSDGKLVGQLGPLPEEILTLLGADFCSDGELLATVVGRNSGNVKELMVWDLKAGEIIHRFPIPNLKLQPRWFDSRYLMVGDTLVDLDYGGAVWTFRLTNPIAEAPDARCWFIYKKSLTAWLASATVPPAEVVSKVKQSVKADQPDIKTFDKLSLQIDVNVAVSRTDLSKELREKIVKRLASRGVTVADGQPNRLVVTVKEKSAGPDIVYEKSRFGITTGLGETLTVPNRSLQVEMYVGESFERSLWRFGKEFPVETRYTENLIEGQNLAEQVLSRRWVAFDAWTERFIPVPGKVSTMSTVKVLGHSILEPDQAPSEPSG